MAALGALAAAGPAAAAQEVAALAGTEFMPSVLVPLTGLVFPAVMMASIFIYIEAEEIE